LSRFNRDSVAEMVTMKRDNYESVTIKRDNHKSVTFSDLFFENQQFQ